MRSIPLTTLGAALALLVPSASMARAQEHAPRDSAAQRIEPQRIRAARGPVVVGGAAASEVRLDSAPLRAAPTLADLLRAVPQVHVRTNSRGEAELSVRGSESRQVAVMLNGLPLSPGWDGRADASIIPLSGVTSLTVLRSTGSLLGGPNAIGGVVDLRVEAPEAGSERRLTMGTDQTGARLLSASMGGVDARTQLHWRAGGGYRGVDGIVRAHGVPDPAPGGALRTNTDLRSRDLFAAVGWDSRRGAGLHALVSAYDAERGVAPELHLAAPRLWRYPAQSRALVQLRGESAPRRWRAGTSRAEVSAGLLSGRTRIESFADEAYTTISGREAGDERVHSLRLAGSHLTPAGLDVKGALTVNEVRYDETLGADPASRFAQRLWSAGLEAQRIVGKRALITGGFVLDDGATLASAGRPAAPTRREPGWRLGATVQLSAELRAHASASSRARFPSLRELYSGALDRFEPNPALRPERLHTTEAGMSWGAVEGEPGVGAQVVAFHHRMDDAVVRVAFAGSDRFIRVNRDETRASGSELLLAWRGARGHLLQLDAVAQRVRIRDAVAGGSGRKPEHLPAFRAALDAGIPLPGGVALGAGLQHLGSQYCVNPELDEDVAIRAQTVLGASLSRSWRMVAGGWRSLRLVLGADNLADAAVYEQCGLPRAGRTLRLAVTLD